MIDFSNKQKLQLFSNIEFGAVFRLLITKKEGIVPKNSNDDSRHKYLIVFGKTDDSIIGFVIINSTINASLSPELKELHYPISHTKYPFLKQPRFVYCGKIFEIELNEFVSRYKGESYGALDSEDMQLIVGAIKSSGIIRPKQLKKFGLL